MVSPGIPFISTLVEEESNNPLTMFLQINPKPNDTFFMMGIFQD
jgi:hypothetical protein